MRILISNDDGIYSPGILALAKVASRFGEVRMVAPDVEQSSMGHAITASRPLRYKRIRLDEFEAYRVNGTPADCVALGTHQWQHTDGSQVRSEEHTSELQSTCKLVCRLLLEKKKRPHV